MIGPFFCRSFVSVNQAQRFENRKKRKRNRKSNFNMKVRWAQKKRGSFRNGPGTDRSFVWSSTLKLISFFNIIINHKKCKLFFSTFLNNSLCNCSLAAKMAGANPKKPPTGGAHPLTAPTKTEAQKQMPIGKGIWNTRNREPPCATGQTQCQKGLNVRIYNMYRIAL